MQISLFNDTSESDQYYRALAGEKLPERLKVLDSRARRKGLASLDASRNKLIPLGMELDGEGRVVKSGYGVFTLAWQAADHPEWPSMIAAEIEEIREGIRRAHGGRLRFLIWVGMGGSAEDKHMHAGLGLLDRGVRCYTLDSTDPAKLKYILADMQKHSARPLHDVLASTLVVGMAMGATSFEPVFILEQLGRLYQNNGVDVRPNFRYMALRGSLLEQFASRRGYERIEIQLDGADTTVGRHSGPLTRGTLYPLAFCQNDLTAWIAGALLSPEDIDAAWKLAAFLHAQGVAGRDKVTLTLARAWNTAAMWTKQDFEESLGKSEELGIKIVIDEKLRLANYRAPKEDRQDRIFLVVCRKGEKPAEMEKLAMIRRVGYPVASVAFERGVCVSRYMQFVHYTVFGVAWLRGMNFVVPPNLELCKSLASRLYEKAKRAGGMEKTTDWTQFRNSPAQRKWIGGVSLHYFNQHCDALENATAAAVYASMLIRVIGGRRAEYGELTFFGDTRCAPQGRALRKVLCRAAELLFRSRLRVPADVYEGPAMNHSYHEMITGHGRCFSTILLADKHETVPGLDYSPDYLRAQFLGTIRALEQRGRDVVAITLRDLEPKTLLALDRFFREAARLVGEAGRCSPAAVAH